MRLWQHIHKQFTPECLSLSKREHRLSFANQVAFPAQALQFSSCPDLLDPTFFQRQQPAATGKCPSQQVTVVQGRVLS